MGWRFGRDQAKRSKSGGKKSPIKLAELTNPSAAAFNLELLPAERRADLNRAHSAIGRLFFGRRIALDDCAAQLRTWVTQKVL
jgi:hypothetical protein